MIPHPAHYPVPPCTAACIHRGDCWFCIVPMMTHSSHSCCCTQEACVLLHQAYGWSGWMALTLAHSALLALPVGRYWLSVNAASVSAAAAALRFQGMAVRLGIIENVKSPPRSPPSPQSVTAPPPTPQSAGIHCITPPYRLALSSCPWAVSLFVAGYDFANFPVLYGIRRKQESEEAAAE